MAANLTSTEQTEAMRGEEQARQDELDATTGIEDQPEQDPPAPAPSGDEDAPEPAARTKPQARSPADEARNAIADRFKRPGVLPFNGDLADPEMLYGEAGRAPTLEPEPDTTVVGDAMPTEPAPEKRVLKIRGQDVELTDQEILERARKVTSADSYLEEARKLLEEAKTIKGERAARDRQPPDGQSSTQDDGLDSDPQQDQGRPHAPGLKEVIEKIQFGDPEEAASELGRFIKTAAKTEADQGHITRLFNNDLVRSQQALKDFTDANPELAKDDLASMAIERSMYALYREDILKLGVVDEAQIPTDTGVLANWHRYYRVHGQPVRSTPELLNAAKDRFVTWRGQRAPTPQPARKEAPRVNVNVDRTERRLAIPNQPTRAVAPRRDVQQTPQRTTGSDVVAEMRKARGQLT